MDTAPKKRAYTKSRLIKELAFRSGITQLQSRAALEAIIEIAYREAKNNYFVLPGLCKFDVVRRKARTVRNPVTGEQMVLPERDALHVTLSKRAKEAVVPRVAAMKAEEYAAMTAQEVVEETAAAEKAEEAVAVAAEPTPEPAAPVAAEPVLQPEVEAVPPPAASQPEPVAPPEPPAPPEPAAASKPEPTALPSLAEAAAQMAEQQPDDGFVDAPELKEGDKAISFCCSICGQEIVAPEETVGMEAECPACGAILVVPEQSQAGTMYASADGESQKTVISEQEAEALDPQVLKNRTIRIDAILFDDAGKPVNGPSPTQAQAMKSRTMRIDLPDEF
ncbi:MAG: HU family DNA-binding protein [Kiritimatiellae bacterium]|nr:HU family DNA-binding protein [Kiritimatiellia bacterium]